VSAVLKVTTGSEAVRRLEALVDRLSPRLARAFREAVDRMRSRIPAEEAARLIEAGRVEELIDLLDPNVTENELQELAAAIEDAVVQGGRLAAEVQPPVLGPGGTVNVVFASANPLIGRYARQISSTRIREIGEDVRAVVRESVAQGTEQGFNPRDTARRVRESVGLTVQQERAVANYRRSLEQGRADVLTRQLRDRRFDRGVARALDSGTPIPAERIDRMVQRYRERYLKYRSEVIGRTEALRSVHGAQRELYESYIQDGKIRREQVWRFWVYTQDGRTRPEHRLIPSMNPGGVGIDTPFQTPLGPLMFPGDPDGLAENVIQCRCMAETRIVSLELIEDPTYDVAERFRQDQMRNNPQVRSGGTA